jgi:hypothetical protein
MVIPRAMMTAVFYTMLTKCSSLKVEVFSHEMLVLYTFQNSLITMNCGSVTNHSTFMYDPAAEMSCAQVLVLWPSDSNRYLSLLDQTRDSKHVSFTISFYMTLQAWFVDCFFPNSSTQWQVLSVLMNGTLKSQLYFYSRLIWHVNVIVGWGGGFFGWVTIVFSRRTLVSGVCCISVRADCKYLSDCAIYTLWQCRCCVWTRLCQSSYIHLIDKWSFWCSQHCEDWCLLRWDGILFKDPATSFTRIDECVCCSLFIYPDDDSRRLPWNIHTLLPHYTVLHCRKPCSLQSLPCKLQTSQSPFFFFFFFFWYYLFLQ